MTEDELSEQCVIFDAGCRELLEFVKKCNTDQQGSSASSLTRLIGSTVDLRVKGYTV